MSGRRRQQYTTIQLTPFGRDSLKSKKKSPRESYEAMLRRFGLLLVFVVLLILPVSAAFTQNFQDTTGFTGCSGGGCTWVRNATGGNSYITTTDGSYVINSVAEQTTYFAVTSYSAFTAVILYDASMTPIYSPGYIAGGDVGRYEIKIEGDSKAHIYVNGVNTQTSGVLSVNPSFIAVNSQLGTSGKIDDIVYGGSAQKVVYDMPQENTFIIKKDFINPASSGFAWYVNGSTIYSNILPSSWSKQSDGINESIVLGNVLTGTIYATHYTGSANFSTYEPWDISTALINSNAPYGEYEMYMPNEPGSRSIRINYLGQGATVAFDKDSYSQQETATITHTVLAGGYWNTAAYNYKLAILSVNTGQFIHNETITTQTGTSTYTWTTSDSQGVYYAVIIATAANGQEIWMNLDFASVSAFITFSGYVNGAETNAVLSGANVSLSQGTTVVNQVTIADGNYSATGFLTGATLTMNVTKSGYSQYFVTLTPMTARSITLNFTLNATPSAATGFAVGGVARTGTLVGTLITGGYGEPISGATITVKNTTNGEQYTKLTNMAGWYLCDEGSSCLLSTKRPYDVWGSKLGYNNSQNYTVITP